MQKTGLSKYLCICCQAEAQGLFEGSMGRLSRTLIFLTSGAEIPTLNALRMFPNWRPCRVHDGNETGSPRKNLKQRAGMRSKNRLEDNHGSSYGPMGCMCTGFYWGSRGRSAVLRTSNPWLLGADLGVRKDA